MEESKPISPIRRSGSPLRRRQIATLEQSGKKPKLQPEIEEKEPIGSIDQDKPSGNSEDVLQKMASAIDKIATAFTTTASQMRDTRLTQKNIMDEMLALRLAVDSLQSDMNSIKNLLEKSSDSKSKE